MTDQHLLHEAFAELERRADVLDAHARPGATRPDATRPDATRPDATRPDATRPNALAHSRAPWLLVAASVVAVLAVAVSIALISANGTGSGRRAGGPPSVSHPGAPVGASVTNSPPVRSSGAPTRSAPPTADTAPPAPSSSPLTPSQVLSAPHSSPPAGSGAGTPDSAAQLATRLRAELGSIATFTYTAPAGRSAAYIAGVLTNTKTRVRGGFDLQTAQLDPGDKASCEDPGESTCSVRRLDDGSSLSTGRESRDGDLLYLVALVRPDGSSLLMHVSNREDPKGAGATYGPRPPLSMDQIVTILRSAAW